MFVRLNLRRCAFKKTTVHKVIISAFVTILWGYLAATSPASAQARLESGVMPAAEKKRLIESVKSVKQGKSTAYLDKFNHPVAVRLHEWMVLQQGDKSLQFGRMASFISNNPEWPGVSKIRRQAEASIPPSMAPALVVSWFKSNKPLTPDGMDAYLAALLKLDHRGEAQEILNEWWEKALISQLQQQNFLVKYGKYINRQSNIRRLDKLLLSGHYTNGRKIAAILGSDYIALAEARIALAEGTGNVEGLIAKVPASLVNDPGLQYERLKWRRKKDLDDRAIEILRNAPPPESVLNPEDWWKERHIIARRMFEKGRYETAYQLAAGHRQQSGLPFAQAEWFAGWIALRKLNKPYEAFGHFEKLYNGVSTPLSKSRGAYWAGLAAQAVGRNDVSVPWFGAAARYPETFYGQLAASKLGRGGGDRGVQPSPGAAEESRWNSREMVQAAEVLAEAGLHEEASSFIAAMLEMAKEPAEYALLAKFAARAGYTHEAVNIAKKAAREDVILPDHAFPTRLELMRPVKLEWAFVHALMLQESAFNSRAISPAGARGLMQVMPATGKEVAGKYGIGHETDWLISNPQHNVIIGSAYMEQLLKRFDGSYILALAAYNAGPSRVSRWIGEFGDPRKPGVDEVDWIETIPIYETRNYVQRVLEGVYVYRAKLAGLQQQPVHAIHVSME